APAGRPAGQPRQPVLDGTRDIRCADDRTQSRPRPARRLSRCWQQQPRFRHFADIAPTGLRPAAANHAGHGSPVRVGLLMIAKVLAPARPLLWFLAAGLALLSVSRLGLALWKFDQVAQVHGWADVLLQGVRVDVATLCLL